MVIRTFSTSYDDDDVDVVVYNDDASGSTRLNENLTKSDILQSKMVMGVSLVAPTYTWTIHI